MVIVNLSCLKATEHKRAKVSAMYVKADRTSNKHPHIFTVHHSHTNTPARAAAPDSVITELTIPE